MAASCIPEVELSDDCASNMDCFEGEVCRLPEGKCVPIQSLEGDGGTREDTDTGGVDGGGVDGGGVDGGGVDGGGVDGGGVDGGGVDGGGVDGGGVDGGGVDGGGCVSSAEVCNGLDDDCDGMTDEPEDLDQPRADLHVGVCEGQVKVCAGADGWVEPEYRAIPDYEAEETLCDGLDNDCDGMTDDVLGGCECVVGASEACGTDEGECSQGTRTCQEGGTWGPCEGEVGPSAEVCNGLDDDCDGMTDEPEDLDQPRADLHVGVCEGMVKVCAGADGWVEPEYRAIPDYEAEETLCDGLDNDCDGMTDDDLVPPAGMCPDLGVCAAPPVKPECFGVEGWRCQFPPEYEGPDEVTCDGLDNDCDGMIDEMIPDCPQSCNEVDCDGHGLCVEDDVEGRRCDCEPGYRAEGPFHCYLTCDGVGPVGMLCSRHGRCVEAEGRDASCLCDLSYEPMGLECLDMRNGPDALSAVVPEVGRLSAEWRMCNQNPCRQAAYTFDTEQGVPVFGDWDGDGLSQEGLVGPGDATNTWMLASERGTGQLDWRFEFGPGASQRVAYFLSGDWEGLGHDGVAVVIDDGLRELRWVFTMDLQGGARGPEVRFCEHGTIPVAGDWDGDGRDTPGCWDVARARFMATNDVMARTVDYDIPTIDTLDGTISLVAGDWGGNGKDTPAFVLYDSSLIVYVPDLEIGFDKVWRVPLPNVFSEEGTFVVAGHWVTPCPDCDGGEPNPER